MKGISSGIGILLLAVGLIFLGQGLNLIKGSFMTGQTFWAVVGLVSAVAGGALLVYGFRGQRKA